MEVSGVASTDNRGPEWHHIFALLVSHLARAISTIAHPAATHIAYPRSAAFALTPEFRGISKP
jgi:hypothetical protein